MPAIIIILQNMEAPEKEAKSKDSKTVALTMATFTWQELKTDEIFSIII